MTLISKLARLGRLPLLALTAAALVAPAARACEPTHLIQAGETLSGIAKDHLGNPWDYPRLHQANLALIGRNPHLIYAGDSLDVPCTTDLGTDLIWSAMPDAPTAQALMTLMDVQVVDLRPVTQLADGALPGTIPLPFATWRGPSDNPGMPPGAARLSTIVGGAGLRLDRPILIVHGRDTAMETGRSALVYWMLKSVGADQLAILRGGVQGWQAAGLPLTQTPRRTTPYAAALTYDYAWRATSVEVMAVSTGVVPGALVDARPHGVYARLGDLRQALATTIPGAGNAPAPRLAAIMGDEIDVTKGAARVLEHYRDHAIDWQADGPTISFCNTGELAALNWFYASEIARLPDQKLYAPSVRGWAQDGGRLAPGGTQDLVAMLRARMQRF